MEKFSKEYFKTLANQIMFDLSDDEVESLQEDFKDMIKQIDILDKVDTSNVEPMVFPFDIETSYLRDDVVSNTIEQDDVLINAPQAKDGQIIVPKVVK